jgi:uncharacterized protein (TIGR02588 family)
MEEHKQTKEGDKRDQKNMLEWTVFALSLLLVLGILAYWTYQAVTQKPGKPDLYIISIPDPSEHNPYRYHLSVHNAGGETAENVRVELSMQKDGQEVEKGELQVAFLPKEGRREGWISFSSDPARADTVIARVVSYEKP